MRIRTLEISHTNDGEIECEDGTYYSTIEDLEDFNNYDYYDWNDTKDPGVRWYEEVDADDNSRFTVAILDSSPLYNMYHLVTQMTIDNTKRNHKAWQYFTLPFYRGDKHLITFCLKKIGIAI